MRIHIIRFELWGNAKDGFDVNDAHTIGREEVPGNDYAGQAIGEIRLEVENV